MSSVRVAGTVCTVGGLTLFCDLGLHLFGGLGRWYFVIAALMALCLLGGLAGLWTLCVVAPGWQTLLGRVGATVVIVGAAFWITAFILLFLDASAVFSQKLTPGGSLLMGIGMILLGIATAASARLPGWRRWVPLSVGVYFPLQLVLQLAFFLNGRDGRPGPNGLLLGTWGLLWALLGMAIVSSSRRTDKRATAASTA
jgi:hypothetical protein